MSWLYHLLIFDPLLNLLVAAYNTIAFHDMGVAIILLTLLIRLLLFPLFHKGARYQAVMQRLQPKLKALQDEHKGNYEAQSKAMLALYKEHNVSPFSGILTLVLQLPILFALYHIFLSVLHPDGPLVLYSFISNPGTLQPNFLGLINLAGQNMVMVVLAAIGQYFQGRLALRKVAPGEKLGTADRMGRQMTFIGPLLTLAIFYKLPAAVSLYWCVTSIFSIGQQLLINSRLRNEHPAISSKNS